MLDVSKPHPWCVYILKCADATLYTGITNRLDARINVHNEGKGAKYTRARLPVKLVYQETVENRSDAQKREIAIKALTKREKLRLIKSGGGSSSKS